MSAPGGGGPTVTLTFAGDSTSLEQSSDRAGSATQRFSQAIDESGRRMQDSGKRLDATREKFDTLDTRAMGFRDTITGLQDGWKAWNDETLSTPERLLTVGFAVGDLASGMANWLIPALGGIAPMARAAWAALTGPVGIAVLAIGALVAAGVWAYNNIAWFRAGVDAAWAGIKSAFSAGVNFAIGLLSWFASLPGRFAGWFGGALGAVTSFAGNLIGRIRALPGQILGALSSLGSLLVNSGRSLIEGLWRGIQGAIGWVKDKIGGALTAIRNLFPFSPAKEGPFSGSGYTTHSGAALMRDFGAGMQGVDLTGVVSGSLGTAQAALNAPARGGAAGGGVIEMRVSGNVDSALVSLLHSLQRRGDLQFVRA